MSRPKEKPNILKMITNPAEQFRRLRRRPEFVFGALVIFVLTFIVEILTTFFRPDVINNIGNPAEWMVTVMSGSVIAMFSSAMAIILMPVVLWLIISIVEPGEDFSYPISIAIYSMIVLVIGSIISLLVALLIGQNPQIAYTSAGAFLAHGLETQEFINNPLYALLTHVDIFRIWMLILVFIGVRIIYETTVVKALIITILYAVLPALGGIIIASIM